MNMQKFSNYQPTLSKNMETFVRKDLSQAITYKNSCLVLLRHLLRSSHSSHCCDVWEIKCIGHMEKWDEYSQGGFIRSICILQPSLLFPANRGLSFLPQHERPVLPGNNFCLFAVILFLSLNPSTCNLVQFRATVFLCMAKLKNQLQCYRYMLVRHEVVYMKLIQFLSECNHYRNLLKMYQGMKFLIWTNTVNYMCFLVEQKLCSIRLP